MPWAEAARQQYRREGLRFASDTRDAEWSLLEPLMPQPTGVGRPRTTDLRAVVDAILYVLATGCLWRALGRDFPSRSTVQGYFYRWREDGTWRLINAVLVRLARETMDRKPTPSAGVIDSQSVKATESGGPRGFDAATRVKGRKRHIVTDTDGSLLALLVSPGNVQDNHGAVPLLRNLGRSFPKLRHIFADRVYRGLKLLGVIADLRPWSIEIVTRTQNVGTFRADARARIRVYDKGGQCWMPIWGNTASRLTFSAAAVRNRGAAGCEINRRHEQPPNRVAPHRFREIPPGKAENAPQAGSTPLTQSRASNSPGFEKGRSGNGEPELSSVGQITDEERVIAFLLELGVAKTDARRWYCEQPLVRLGGRVACDVVAAGEVEEVLQEIDRVARGGYA